MKLLNDVVSKAETLMWFMARPSMHRELVRRVLAKRFISARSDEQQRVERERGGAWCAEVARSLEDVLTALGMPGPVASVSALHADAWTQALQAHAQQGRAMGGPAHLDMLYHVCRQLQPERVLETGVAAGWSSLAILLALEANGRGRLVSVDMPYPKRGNEAFVGCVVPAHLRSRWELVRQPDGDALPRLIPKCRPLDLAHYDSDKSYEGRLFAYQRLWEALRPGGLLLSDDVEDNTAFRDFAQAVGCSPLVLRKQKNGNFAGILQR